MLSAVHVSFCALTLCNGPVELSIQLSTSGQLNSCLKNVFRSDASSLPVYRSLRPCSISSSPLSEDERQQDLDRAIHL
eukprot:10511-Heterococcus_DN1.PRE.4